LSESLSLGLTAILLAAWLWVVRAPTWTAAGTVLAITLVWVFARDSNAYLALATAILLLASLLHRPYRRLKLVLALGTCAIVVASLASADAGGRWKQPMRDILLNRVDKDPGMRDYFEAQLGPSWRELDARRVYARYLLSHPGYALGEPFVGSRPVPFSSPDNLSSLIDPDLRIYDDNAGDRILTLPRFLNAILFPRGLLTILTVVAVVAIATSVVAARLGVSSVWAVPIVALISTFPHGLVVWHLSALEVDRHALQVAVILRLALLLLVVLALDAVLQANEGVVRAARRRLARMVASQQRRRTRRRARALRIGVAPSVIAELGRRMGVSGT
jgi:hypothetical protein